MSKSRPRARRLDTLGVYFRQMDQQPRLRRYRARTPGGRAVHLRVGWSASVALSPGFSFATRSTARYLGLSSGHVVRNPYTRPLLHNGRKAKR